MSYLSDMFVHGFYPETLAVKIDEWYKIKEKQQKTEEDEKVKETLRDESGSPVVS